MPIPIALQLYTLRDQAAQDFAGVLRTVAEIGYKGVEFAGLHGMSPSEVRAILDELGLVATSAHVPVFDPDRLDEVMAEAEVLGYKYLVGGFGPEQFASEDKIQEAAETCNAAIEKASARGFTVCLHNHWWEYDGPDKGEKLLELCPKLSPQFDIYWVATGGADPAALIDRYADRTKLLHIKDGPCIKDAAMTAVGQGKVDVPAAIHAGQRAGVEWAIVELDTCDTDMLQAVKDSYTYLVSNGLAAGNK